MAPMDRTCGLNLLRQGLGSFIRDLVYVAGMGLDIWTPNLSSCFLKRGNNKVERKLGMDILRQSAAYCVGFGSVEARCGAPELFAIVTPSTPVHISSCRAFFLIMSAVTVEAVCPSSPRQGRRPPVPFIRSANRERGFTISHALVPSLLVAAAVASYFSYSKFGSLFAAKRSCRKHTSV